MTDKRSVNNITNTICTIIFFLFAGLFLTIKSLAAEGVDISTPSNFILMSSGGSNNLTASGTNDGNFSNWNPGNNVWYDSNGIPHYQTVATGQVFTGSSDLLGSPVFAPVAAAGTSDFYGTTTASTSSNILGGSREYNADNFNGNFSADASGLTTSYIDIHDSNFAASKQASVTANNGTVMEMYDNNFNGNTTINAASGGTVNVTLGNSQEMQTLLSYTLNIQNFTNTIRRYIIIISDNLSTNRLSDSVTSYTLTDPVSGTSFNVNLSNFYYRIYSYSNESVNYTSEIRYSNFRGWLHAKLSEIEGLLGAYSNMIASWFYPLKSVGSNYWIAYNTDTGLYDHVNLATVFGYITWYLGQLYDDGTNISQNMQQMTQDIGTAATTFQDLNQKEQAAINQIQNGFETFLPDPTEFQSFRAITWCSNYLQQIYLALGAYGQVIFIALLFGVCLQFIGYFRYK